MPVLSPLEQIAAKQGLTLDQLREEAPPEPVPVKHQTVKDGPELRRILALPRRPPPAETPEQYDLLARQLTTQLARCADPYPCGRQYGKRNTGYMRPIQAAALRECWEYGGLFGPIRAGYGKTLLAYLLPVVLNASRPLYVCPASLRPDVRKEFHLYYRDWKGPHPDSYRIASYQTLGAKGAGTRLDEKGQKLRDAKLDQWTPDLVIFDEAQFVKNHDAVVTRRVKRFLESNRGVRVVAMSGTMMRKSYKDFAHLARWALPRHCPVPTTYAELEAWADALDHKDSLGPRCDVGALIYFATADEQRVISSGDEDEARTAARLAVRRRMVETPGVVATQDGPLGIPLAVEPIYPVREDPAIDAVFARVRRVMELPNGMPIVDGLQYARHAWTLGLGFWTHWDPPPPDEWLMLRREWAEWCRDVIRYNRRLRGLDAESDVKDAVRKGLLNDRGLLAAWEQLEPSYDPEQFKVAVWVSDEIVQAAGAWVDKHPGIVWTKHIPVGERLSRELGIPYYGSEGLDASGRYIMDHPKGRPMIASEAANRMGRNLQKGWSEGLLLCPPDEQLLARMHRDGQDADEVRFYQYLGSWEHLNSYWKAKAIAQVDQEAFPQAMRLCYADDSTIPSLESLGARTEPRWARWLAKTP